MTWHMSSLAPGHSESLNSQEYFTLQLFFLLCFKHLFVKNVVTLNVYTYICATLSFL